MIFKRLFFALSFSLTFSPSMANACGGDFEKACPPSNCTPERYGDLHRLCPEPSVCKPDHHIVEVKNDDLGVSADSTLWCRKDRKGPQPKLKIEINFEKGYTDKDKKWQLSECTVKRQKNIQEAVDNAKALLYEIVQQDAAQARYGMPSGEFTLAFGKTGDPEEVYKCIEKINKIRSKIPVVSCKGVINLLKKDKPDSAAVFNKKFYFGRSVTIPSSVKFGNTDKIPYYPIKDAPSPYVTWHWQSAELPKRASSLGTVVHELSHYKCGTGDQLDSVEDFYIGSGNEATTAMFFDEGRKDIFANRLPLIADPYRVYVEALSLRRKYSKRREFVQTGGSMKTQNALTKCAVEAGPLLSNADAQGSCGGVCKKVGGVFGGGWWTTKPGVMSICECVMPACPS
jgi:hypothetical protein